MTTSFNWGSHFLRAPSMGVSKKYSFLKLSIERNGEQVTARAVTYWLSKYVSIAKMQELHIKVHIA